MPITDNRLDYVRFLWEAEYEAKLARSFDQDEQFDAWKQLYDDTAHCIEAEFGFDPRPIHPDLNPLEA